DVLGLYAIESSISTHTNAHTHGAAASARRSVVMPSGDAPSGRDGAVPRARRTASTSGARHLAAATQPTSTAAAASDAVVVNGVNRYAVRFVSAVTVSTAAIAMSAAPPPSHPRLGRATCAAKARSAATTSAATCAGAVR